MCKIEKNLRPKSGTPPPKNGAKKGRKKYLNLGEGYIECTPLPRTDYVGGGLKMPKTIKKFKKQVLFVSQKPCWSIWCVFLLEDATHILGVELPTFWGPTCYRVRGY